MSRKIAIIGASYLQLPLIDKAKEMGLETHVFAWAANDVGEEAADYFYPISIIEKEEILDKCSEIGIDGVTSISSDLASVTVNYVANALGLNGNSMECVRRSTNKHVMREEFRNAGDPSPKSMVVDVACPLDAISMRYPIIVKPTDRSGSRGVTKLENNEGLEAAVERAINSSFEKRAVIEEFAEGEEYSVEYVSYKGKHHFLALTYKYTTGAPNFIERGHIEPAEVDSKTLNKVKDVIEKALDTLEITNGASHSEIKIDSEGEIRIIEIGARMGGDMIGSDLVYYSTGIDYVKAVIQICLGEEPDLRSNNNCANVGIRYLIDDEDKIVYERLLKENPDILVKTNLDTMERIIDSSANRISFFLIKADNRDMVAKYMPW